MQPSVKTKGHYFWSLVNILIIVFGSTASLVARDQLELASSHAQSVGGSVVRIEGQSMEPRLMENDLVVVVPVLWNNLKAGDVVQFRVNDEIRAERNSLPTWVHQVTLKDGNWIRTVGVNNPTLDPFWIHKKDVIGKAVAVYIGGDGFESISDKAKHYFESRSASANLTNK